MCQKQCRDENGFKCHLSSEGHKRQMDVFGQNPGRVIEGYSEEFEATFLEHLRRSHPFSRVSANVVYNEYINDRNHIHMNSTRWLTLSEFVKYLGREGKCKVDETPKGWYISYVHKDEAEVSRALGLQVAVREWGWEAASVGGAGQVVAGVTCAACRQAGTERRASCDARLRVRQGCWAGVRCLALPPWLCLPAGGCWEEACQARPCRAGGGGAAPAAAG